MPVQDGMGYSRATPLKQFALQRASGAIIGKAVRVALKWGSPCVVVDMTSGPGMDPKGADGSPLVLARHVQYFRASDYDIRLVCVDRNSGFLDALAPLLRCRFPDLDIPCYNDQEHALRGVPKGALGLSYWDTTRYTELDVELLAWHGRHHRFLDILFSRECLAGFRQKRAAHTRDNVRLIDEYLALTGKENGYVMKYANWGWWSFGFASNLADWPKLERMFHHVNSPEGQNLLDELTGNGHDEGHGDGQESLL